jgi:hypothetical protein
MFDPNTHGALLQQFADRFGLPTSGPMIEPWTRQCMEQFRFSDPGQNWGCKSTSNGSPVSDTFAISTGGRLLGYDCVVSAGAPYASLNLHPEELDITGQHFIPVTAKDHLGTAPVHSTLLGCSLFYGPRAFRDNWPCLRPNLKWIRDDLGADYVRSFNSVGTDDPSNPWRHAGVFMSWSNHDQIVRDFVRMCFEEYGLKQHKVVTAGADPGWVTESEIKDSCRRFCDSLADIAHMFVLIESQNEYKVNAHPNFSPSHFVRMLGWEIIPKFPGVPYALSSPDSIMGGWPDEAVIAAEVEKMHSGHPATAITEHWCRNSSDLSLHRPMNLGPHAPAQRWSTEPIGPYSSVVSSTDPGWLASRYQLAIDAHFKGYTFHTDPGIWSNRLNASRPDMGQWENIFDVENAGAIAERLRELRKTGSSGSGGGGGNGGGGGGGGDDVIPYDESKSVDFGLAINASGAPIVDPGMISVHSQRAAWDYYSGNLSWEESKKKHVNDYKAEYGLPPD